MIEENISNISDDSENEFILKKSEVNSVKSFLNGLTIGISISESENLNEIGYGPIHLKDAIIELARYILVVGGKLSYGGDMRKNGFTELLFELLMYYKADGLLQPKERFFSYLAYPLSTQLSLEKEAGLKNNVTFKKIAPPNDIEINDVDNLLTVESSNNLYYWSRCLTKMRQEMEMECNARVFIGGRKNNFKGKYPGVLEEVIIALEHNHPIYLVGAFGGMTQDIIQALKGEEPESFSVESYYGNENYRNMVALYNEKHIDDSIDYKKQLSILQKIGLDEIGKLNGLSLEDNERLTKTPHVSEIIYLILKGLKNCFKK